MISSRKKENLFWRHKAGAYPMPFDPIILKKTSRLIRLAERLGADFRGRTLLDIGCGTGIYTLVLAKKTGRALGMDFSDVMLKRLRAEAERRGIKNVAVFRGDWSRVKTSFVAKKFDIALASMTHAVISYRDLRKMEAAAREICVYIGWAGGRKNPLWEKIYARHGLRYLPPEGVEKITPLLKKLGRKFKTVYLRESWRRRGKPAEALKDIEISLKVNNAEPDRAWLKKIIKSRTRNGMLTYTTTARKGLIVWRPGPKLLCGPGARRDPAIPVS